MKKISIVTVNFNSEQQTHELLSSLGKVKIDGFLLSIIVVDNGSKTPFIPQTLEKKNTTIFVTTGRNLGFAGGYNVGIQRALGDGADYVVVLNNDTVVDINFLAQFYKTAVDNPRIGIIVPKIYFAKGHEFHKNRYKKEELGKVIWYAGGYMDWKNVFSRHRGVDEIDHGQYDTEENIDFATGCCMWIPRQIFEAVGLFDEKLFLYFEDADLSQRVLQKGYGILYQPKAVIWHSNGASGGGSGSSLHDYYLTRNRMIFGMRYAPLRAKAAVLRESIRLLFFGRQWQKRGIQDFFLRKFGKGSYPI